MKTSFKRFMSLVLVVLTLVACCVPALAASTEADHVHKYSESSKVVTVVEPTCSKQGYTLYECDDSDCKEAFIPDDAWTAIDESKHDWVEKEQLDCINGGFRWSECTLCGENANAPMMGGVYETVDASEAGHTYEYPADFNCAVGATVKCTVCKNNVVLDPKKCEEGCAGVCTHAHYAVSEFDASAHGYADKLNKCDACGETDVVKHNFVTTVIKAPTCADGKMEFACDCGVKFEVKIAKTLAGGKDAAGMASEKHLASALVDKYAADPDAGAATCTADGYSAWVECTECGEKEVLKTVVPKLDHKNADGTTAYVKGETQVRDCENDGFTKWTCALCGDVTTINPETKLDTFEAMLGHKETVSFEKNPDGTWKDWVVVPNDKHDNVAKAYVTCENTGCDYRELKELPRVDYADKATGELPADSVYATFNNKDFYVTYYHGFHKIASNDSSRGVNSNTTIPATCTRYGQRAEVCVDCGWQGKTSAIDKLDHVFNELVPESKPTCLVDGYTQHYECSNEGCTEKKPGTYTVTKAPGKHDTTNVGSEDASLYQAPVCGTDGWYICKGTNCDAKDNKVTIDALEHDYKKVIEVAATCIAVDNYVWKCQRECCENAAAPSTVNGSDDESATTQTTWLFDGTKGSYAETDYNGVAAGYGTTNNPDGHLIEVWYTDKPATCFAQGDKHGTCTLCGKNDVTGKIPVLEHKHLAGNQIKVENIPADYKLADGTVDLEALIAAGYTAIEYPASCTKYAYIMYTCSYMADDKGTHHWFEKTTGNTYGHQFDSESSKVQDYLAPGCTTEGHEEKYICIACGETDPTTGRNGATIPSKHADMLNATKALTANTTYFTYTAAVAAGCKLNEAGDRHVDNGLGHIAYFTCNDTDCAQMYSWDGTKYVEATAESVKRTTTEGHKTITFDIHCPKKSCTDHGTDANTPCSGNGLTGKVVCTACNATVVNGTVETNTATATNGHLYVTHYEMIPETCYSDGTDAGWKCTCGVKSGLETLPKVNHSYETEVIKVTVDNPVYAQSEDNCVIYQYTFTVCKFCKTAAEDINNTMGTNASKFSYDAMSKASVTTGSKVANYIVWVEDAVPHMNADDKVLVEGWGDMTCVEIEDHLGEGYTDADLICKKCGKGSKDNDGVTPLKGDANPFKVTHTADNATFEVHEPTCMVNGYTVKYCVDCNKTMVEDIKLAGDAYHDWEETPVDATELIGSHVIKICKICEKSGEITYNDDKLAAFSVKLEVVGDVFVKSGILQVKVVLVNVLDKELKIQGVQATFDVTKNLIYRDVEFTPVDGFDKSLAKVEANIKNDKAVFVMNTYSDKDGNKNVMTIPANAEFAIATISFVISDIDRTKLDDENAENFGDMDSFKLGVPEVTVLHEASVKYGIKKIENAEAIEKDVTLLGDANFDNVVNVTDSQMLADLLAAADENFEGTYNKALDVNKDGKITIADLAHLQRYMTGRYDAMEFYNLGLAENEIWAE